MTDSFNKYVELSTSELKSKFSRMVDMHDSFGVKNGEMRAVAVEIARREQLSEPSLFGDDLAVTTFGPLVDDNPKTVFGSAKPSTSAIPPIAVLHLGKAMAFGGAKYGRFNWREKGVTTSVYTDAMQRHLLAFCDGEDIASDSKTHHLAHVMACCAILLDAAAVDKLTDDRPKDGPTSRYIDTTADKQ